MIFDAGTTTLRAALLLPDDRELTAVTTAIPLAAHLSGEIRHQRMQRGDLYGRGIGKHRHRHGCEPDK